jgi:hypothetical protein
MANVEDELLSLRGMMGSSRARESCLSLYRREAGYKDETLACAEGASREDL